MGKFGTLGNTSVLQAKRIDDVINDTVTRTLATGTMPHCEGPAYGSPLSLPDWKKVVPAADPALTTDALGGTKVDDLLVVEPQPWRR